ncbi:MAG: PTS sugar transporter subunit IIA [Spirochaetaceae bacterium]|nr:PTS sugar transporter subunit IIA [Spirochaetaceae bacterium]
MEILPNIVRKMDTTCVLTNVEVNNWKEAVRISGSLLYKAGKVSEKYIEGMIKTTNRLGPYAVIAPGIALPHSRPEDGAFDFGLSVVILRVPVDFDSPNDPVKIIIGFSAPTNSAHIQLLKELGMLLQNKEFQKRLKHAKTPQQVVSIFKEFVIQEEGD